MSTRRADDPLPISKIDPNSPIPLYHQIEMDLRRLIAEGELLPDDVLPPENDLSKMYRVGRHTMRVALGRLVTDGLLARQAGRGTFVKLPPDRTNFYLDRSFTQQMAEMGMQAHSRVLRTSSGMIDSTAPLPLREMAGAAYFQLVRLRFGDEIPIGLQSTTIITERCKGIEGYDFNTESLYDVLSRQYKLVITQIEHGVSAVLAGRTEADLLGIGVGDPLLLVKTTAHLDSGEVIEYTLSQYRADRYEYSTTHTYG